MQISKKNYNTNLNFYQKEIPHFKFYMKKYAVVFCPFCGVLALIINLEMGKYSCSYCDVSGRSIKKFQKDMQSRQLTTLPKDSLGAEA